MDTKPKKRYLRIIIIFIIAFVIVSTVISILLWTTGNGHTKTNTWGLTSDITLQETAAPDVSTMPTTEIIQTPDTEISSTTENTENNLILDITHPPQPIEIVNLPDELYHTDESTYANNLRYDFIVKKQTNLTITVETLSGDFNLGIQDKDSKDFVYEMKNFQSGTDIVILEPGNYSIIIKESKHYGSYHIVGNPI